MLVHNRFKIIFGLAFPTSALKNFSVLIDIYQNKLTFTDRLVKSFHCIYLFAMCAWRMDGVLASIHACGSQRTTRIMFSPFMRVPGMELRFTGLVGKCL